MCIKSKAFAVLCESLRLVCDCCFKSWTFLWYRQVSGSRVKCFFLLGFSIWFLDYRVLLSYVPSVSVSVNSVAKTQSAHACLNIFWGPRIRNALSVADICLPLPTKECCSCRKNATPMARSMQWNTHHSKATVKTSAKRAPLEFPQKQNLWLNGNNAQAKQLVFLCQPVLCK